jgi:hypothetical protein
MGREPNGNHRRHRQPFHRPTSLQQVRCPNPPAQHGGRFRSLRLRLHQHGPARLAVIQIVGRHMSDENPIVTWEVQLTGSPGTLRRWERFFTDPENALVEHRNGDLEEQFFLTSTRFADLRANEISGVAADLVSKINNIIALFGGAEPISAGLGVPIFADGSRGKIVVVDTLAPFEIGPTSDTVNPEAEKDQVLWLLRLAEREENVADALRFLNRGTWPDLYFACEVIARDCGDQHELRKKPWATRYELDLVKGNANLYRHTRPTSRPSRILSLPEARGLLDRAIRAWVAEKS